MRRRRILITGASSGLGAGMARAFAAREHDVALCARRFKRLEKLKAELTEHYPDIRVAVAALDVNDHQQVPRVFAELSDQLGGIDRVIVNAGVGGDEAPLGSGQLRTNKAIIETNLVAALVQIETALEMFKTAGSGHLVLISSVADARGIRGVSAAYAASKAGLRSLGESLRAENARGPIKISVIEPGSIESEMTPMHSAKFMVDNATGVELLVRAIEREPGRAVVPWWPWAPIMRLMRATPQALIDRFS
jgi:short-subunit dehydrogenase